MHVRRSRIKVRSDLGIEKRAGLYDVVFDQMARWRCDSNLIKFLIRMLGNPILEQLGATDGMCVSTGSVAHKAFETTY
jgi:hypothetical protein